MKKSSFAALVLGMISCMFFGMGMCMALLPEWNAFRPGIVTGCIGLLLALITVLVWRKMEHKEPVRFSARAVLTVLLGIIGALTLGIGMCLVMVWSRIFWGIAVGCVGIVLLIGLIPVCKGLK